MTTQTLLFLLPEIVVIATAIGIYMGGVFVETRRLWAWIALGGVILAALVARFVQFESPVGGPITADSLALFGRYLALLLGGLLVLTAMKPPALGLPHGRSSMQGGPLHAKKPSSGYPEYLGSLLLTVAGLMLAAEASDLVLIFVSLELISIPTYVLLYLGRGESASQEAAVKYFFLSLLASAILLYGFTYLYGSTGTTSLSAMQDRFSQSSDLAAGFDKLLKLAVILVFAGLCFKISAVPFHFYAPDVFQGTTYANAALLSAVPKAAGLLVLMRIAVLTLSAAPVMETFAWQIALALAVLSMTYGNFVALWQDNLRRILAYSAIAQAGYMLAALAAGLTGGSGESKLSGLGAAAFYIAVYILASVGALAALSHLGRRRQQLESVDELAGLGRARPWTAAMLAVFMLSLTGIPPLAGFWGKLLVFSSALNVDAGATGQTGRREWFVALAIIGVLNAAVSAAYYLRIISVMYFRAPVGKLRAQGGLGAWLAAVACAVLVVAIGLYPGPLMRQSNAAGNSLSTIPNRVVADDTAAKSMVESR